LWDALGGSNDPHARAALIEHYLPFARVVAARVYGLRAGAIANFDDYLQYARLGLIEAIDRFDVTRGISFESYAVHRVRGAVLNGIGQESENAAQREFRRSMAQERVESVVAHAGTTPHRASLAELIEITVGIAVGLVLESEPVDETPGANPYAVAELEQFSRRVRHLVDALPEREREVIKGHYYERLEFQEIARRTGVTKGRVSQLHAKALAHLRERLAETPRVNCRL
jgi:RNA polymerase sigma factor for flagellar operon FliA